MESSYLLLVGMLFTLAVVDLMVGVSNDAVNFLNSAIGSKVASMRTILIVASVGIFIGAVFSSGMMEVARKGIFRPSLFSMDEIMIIFLAVMVTDILLLDFFNSVALPTSTTVSIVFELLGAALILAIIKSGHSDELVVLDYINTKKALEIISGIFLSVGVAFSIGAIVQFFTRLWFTFDFERLIPKFGWLFGGLAISAISYFVLIKGLKNSSFLEADQVHWIKEHTWTLVLYLFAISAVILFALYKLARIHPLKMVVLAGTFALAMAFAGNDLVNFIGVPVTGFQTYQAHEEWQSQGGEGEFSLAFLEEAVPTSGLLLGLAGVIMVLTLWFSGKARKVTETEVNLGRQDAGAERFKPHFLSRFIVESSMRIAKLIIELLPNSFTNGAQKRLDKNAGNKAKGDAAFDLVRASANLMVASVLIAIASSMKLPLSTTYVSFMVAMGTSLADQAWGRESAVYRVAGVLNVIGGWFMTAMTALVASGLAALLFYHFGLPAIIILFCLAAFLIIRSHTRFVKKKKEEQEKELADAEGAEDRRMMIDSSRAQLSKTIHELRKILRIGIREIPRENRKMVKKASTISKDLFENSRKRQKQSLKIFEEENKEVQAVRQYLLLQNELQELEQISHFMLQEISEFLANKHEPPSGLPMELLLESEKELTELLLKVETSIDESHQNFATIQDTQQKFLENTDERLEKLLAWAKENKSEQKKAVFLCISLLMDSKDIANSSLKIFKSCSARQ